MANTLEPVDLGLPLDDTVSATEALLLSNEAGQLPLRLIVAACAHGDDPWPLQKYVKKMATWGQFCADPKALAFHCGASLARRMCDGTVWALTPSGSLAHLTPLQLAGTTEGFAWTLRSHERDHLAATLCAADDPATLNCMLVVGGAPDPDQKLAMSLIGNAGADVARMRDDVPENLCRCVIASRCFDLL